MTWLGSPGKDHPYARPSEAELLARRRQHEGPVRRGRFMVIAAFAYIFVFAVRNWYVLAVGVAATGSTWFAVQLLVQVVIFAALAYETYVGHPVARHVTAFLCGLAAVVLFADLFKANEEGNFAPSGALIIGSLVMLGFAAIAVGLEVSKDVRQFVEHQRQKRLGKAR